MIIFSVFTQICSTNSILVLFCNRFSAQSSSMETTKVFSLGTATEIIHSEVSVCWSSGTQDTSFAVGVGILEFIGPNKNDYRCASGISCIVSLSGQGFSATNGLVFSQSGCGVSHAAVSIPEFNKLFTPSSYRTNEYNLGEFFGSGVFDLCWSHSIPEQMIDAVVHAGILSLDGPISNNFVCWLGDLCEFTLSGQGLHEDNMVRVVSVLSSQQWTHSDVCGGVSSDANVEGLKAYASPSPSNTYDFGIALDEPGTDYALCWGDQPNSLRPSDFTVLVGSFQLNGPFQNSDTVCYPGVNCIVHLDGVGLQSMNRLALISGSCDGNSPFLVGPSGIQSVSTTYNGFAHSFGASPTVFDAEAFLCWSRQATGDAADIFIVEVGVIFFHGPTFASHECTLGVRCTFNLPGISMPQSGTLRVAEAGGCSHTSERVELGGLLNLGVVNLVDGVSVDLGIVNTTHVAESYDLCWSMIPNEPWSATVHIGTVEFLGPSPQDFECVIPNACSILLSGNSLNAGNRVLLAKSCSETDMADAFMGPLNPATYWEPKQFSVGVLTELDESEYSVCWVSSLSGNPKPSYVHVGQLFLKGPIRTHFDCMLGHPQRKCELIWRGDSAVTESTMILFVEPGNSCSTGTPPIVDFAGVNNPLTTIPSGNGQYRYEFDPQSGANEMIQICWKADNSENSWSVNAGTMDLIGPFTSSFSCTLGSVCSINVEGVQLSSTNRVLLALQNCDTPLTSVSSTNEFAVSGLNTPGYAQMSSVTLQEHNLGTITNADISRPTQYMVCFSHDSNLVKDFSLSLGALDIVGPFVADSHCAQGQSCSVHVDGEGISSLGQQLLMRSGVTCGSDASVALNVGDDFQNPRSIYNGVADFQLLPALAPGSFYKLCWYSGSDPADPEQFSVEVDGDFEVLGVVEKTVSCIVGQYCSFFQSAYGLDRLRPMLLILSEDSSPCGQWNAEPATIPGYDSMVLPDEDSSDREADWALGISSVGIPGIYGLCFGAYAEDNPSRTTEFNVPTGKLHLLGPQRDDFACTLGEKCSVTLDGLGMAGDYASLIVLSDGECGSQESTLAYKSTLASASSRSVGMFGASSDNGIPVDVQSVFEFDIWTIATQATLSLCWQHGVASSSQNLETFSVPVGSIHIQGPLYNSNGYICTNGVECLIDLSGSQEQFSRYDRIAVTNAPECSQISPFNLIDVGLTNPQGHDDKSRNLRQINMGISTAGQGILFRLCFARSPTVINHYTVEVGRFILHGPAKSDYNCRSTLDCIITIRGTGFTVTNGLMIKSGTSKCDGPDTATIFGPGFTNPALPAATPKDIDAPLGNMQVSFNLEVAITSDPTAKYYTCWSSHFYSESFNVQVGTLLIGGAIPDVYSCWSGTPCSPLIRGRLLDQTSKLAIVSGDSCSSDGVVQFDSSSGIRNPAQIEQEQQTYSSQRGGNEIQFSFGDVVYVDPSRVFLLCFAFEDESGNSQFLSEVQDSFHFRGLQFGDYECTMGASCAPTFSGLKKIVHV